MPKIIKNVTDMEIDEISLVDRGANQHALVTITKRAPEEDNMPEIDLYNDQGELLDQDSLGDGDVVYDDEGNAYEFTLEDEEAAELETVGKNYTNPFLDRKPVSKSQNRSYADLVMEELSKADSDDARDEVLAKAFGRMEELENEAKQTAEIAKAERDLRLTREYISKAAEYNVPVDPAELGPVLYRMAEAMNYEDCSVIAKCLEASGAMLFEEVGNIGGGDNDDIMSRVDGILDSQLSKSESGINKADSVVGLFDQAPEAYDQYRAERS